MAVVVVYSPELCGYRGQTTAVYIRVLARTPSGLLFEMIMCTSDDLTGFLKVLLSFVYHNNGKNVAWSGFGCTTITSKQQASTTAAATAIETTPLLPQPLSLCPTTEYGTSVVLILPACEVPLPSSLEKLAVTQTVPPLVATLHYYRIPVYMMFLGCGCRVAPRAGASAGRLTQQTAHGSIRRGGAGAKAGAGARSLVGNSRPALANILIGDATDPVCESVFRSRGHAVDFKPGLSKVCVCLCVCLVYGVCVMLLYPHPGFM